MMYGLVNFLFMPSRASTSYSAFTRSAGQLLDRKARAYLAAPSTGPKSFGDVVHVNLRVWNAGIGGHLQSVWIRERSGASHERYDVGGAAVRGEEDRVE